MMKLRTRLKVFKGMPDMTPIINVVFLLLLFFMLSSSFVQISGIKINLPKTEGENELGAEKLIISIDKNNRFFFNDEQLEWNSLKEKPDSLLRKAKQIRSS
jgi:biopolymer transport protein ExbD